MDLEALLQARGDDEPSGEDLEYDPAFTELELAAQPGEEKQAGDQILAAEEPDYKEVAAKALAVMERSHDLRAGVFLALANVRLKGFPGFAEATDYIRGCLEQHWDTCHPQLDADDDNDPTMRVNAVLALADPDTILRGARLAPLTESKTFGRLSLRDIAVAEGEIAAPADMKEVPDGGAVSAAFQDTDDEQLKALLAAIESASDNVKAISEKFDEEVPGQGPDLDPLLKILKQARGKLVNATGGEAEEESDADADGNSGTAPSGGGGSIGGINSPNDVQNALDRIIAYYERSEPSSPLPLLLKRAKRLVSADFLTIVKDMAPHGVENVNTIGGLEDADDD